MSIAPQSLMAHRMNSSSSPIDSLPNEVLALIQEEAVISKWGAIADLANLSSISRVCKRWRQTSLSNGILWTAAFNLDLQPFSGVKEVFRRAKGSPLQIISLDGYNSDCTQTALFQNFASDNWKYAFENAHRWGVFKIQTHIHTPTDITLADNLKRRFPLLKTFALENSHNATIRISGIPQATGDWRDEAFILPDELFGGHAPHLQTFFTSHVYFSPSFDFSLWRNLTCLRIVQASRYYDRKYIMPDWLIILRPMVLLEYLELKGIFNFHPNSTYVIPINFLDGPEVHLKHLSVLKLGTTYSETSHEDVMLELFLKLIVPSSCKISFSILCSKGFECPPHILSKFEFVSDRQLKALDEAYPDRSIRMQEIEPEEFQDPKAPDIYTTKVWHVDSGESDYLDMVPNFEVAIEFVGSVDTLED